jgi:hypothetical protein
LISVYDGFALVDDRRIVELDGGGLAVDHVDPGAALASLVIESDLAVGACRRELPAGRVRCVATGTPGRHLVRVLYVSTALRYRGEHEIAITTAGRARIVERFAIDTPAWGGRADLTLYDGAPGSERVPHEVARGTITLDGSTAVLVGAPREVPATLRRVFDGAVLTDTPATDAAWGRDSQQAVWVWLDLASSPLAPGPVRVHVDVAGERRTDVIVPAEGRSTDPSALRLPLWVDSELVGSRSRFVDLGGGAALAERLLLGVFNAGSAPREVWIEEHARPARRHHIERAWPTRPAFAGDLVRSHLVVKPGGFERVGYTIAYEM